jgi:hypothetical protein
LKRNLFLLLPVLLILTGCWEKTSNNAEKSFALWAGQKPGKDVKAIHGKYRQSAHFTREYTVYLELAPTVQWKLAFIKENHLHITSNNPALPQDAPSWFINKKGLNVWRAKPDNGDLYEEDSQTGHFFIYEEQL